MGCRLAALASLVIISQSNLLAFGKTTELTMKAESLKNSSHSIHGKLYGPDCKECSTVSDSEERLKPYGLNLRKFPEGFKFGVATASYQVEGGWNADDKGENIWDRLTHTRPELITDHSSGDVACDSYGKYEEDVQLVKDLGVQYYRFSLSWSRILPTGFTNRVNQKGVAYYRNLINALKKNGIEPMVTLFHWDLPQPMQDIGGWPNPLLVEHFANYARLAFKLFGDDVKLWLTFNEIKQICQQGYGGATMAPAIASPGIGEYLCAHTVLKSHAKAYHIYHDEFQPTQKGRISLVIDSNWYEPESAKPEDSEAAERTLLFTFGWYAHPVVFGNYPQVMINRIGNRSTAEGFPKSRLPEFTSEESKQLKGSYDYFGVNHYTTSIVRDAPEAPIGSPSWEKDYRSYMYQNSSWPSAASAWLKVVPWGIRKLVKWVKDTYNNPEIIITENGVSDTGLIDDPMRTSYYRDYLSNLLDAIYEDGVHVTGYTAWSLMDNFEWFRGYTEKFGIYHVDFNSPNRTRTPKTSASYFKQVATTKCLASQCIN